jgi:hypothetical protein
LGTRCGNDLIIEVAKHVRNVGTKVGIVLHNEDVLKLVSFREGLLRLIG